MFNNKAGQSLFEVLFAVAIVSLIIIGLVSLSEKTVRNESFAQNKALAAEYAQQVVEWIRGERDVDWDTFSTSRATVGGTTWCLPSLVWPGTAGSCGSTTIAGTIFAREATLTLVSSDEVRSVVVVSWSDSQGYHDVRSVTELTNWRR